MSTQLRVSLTVSSWSGRTKDLGSCYRNYNCKKFGKLSARFWKCFFFKLNNQIPHQILFLILKYQFTFPSLFSKSRTGRNRVIINFLFFFSETFGKVWPARKILPNCSEGFIWFTYWFLLEQASHIAQIKKPNAFKMNAMIVLSFEIKLLPLFDYMLVPWEILI